MSCDAECWIFSHLRRLVQSQLLSLAWRCCFGLSRPQFGAQSPAPPQHAVFCHCTTASKVVTWIHQAPPFVLRLLHSSVALISAQFSKAGA